jgi:hypothetical protein
MQMLQVFTIIVLFATSATIYPNAAGIHDHCPFCHFCDPGEFKRRMQVG